MKRLNIADINTPDVYNKHYTTESVLTFAAREAAESLMKILFRNGKVLDVGCGIGNYFPSFSDCEIHGIDFCPDAISIAKSKYPTANLKLIDFLNNPTYLPYNDSYFDYLFLGEVLEHIEDPRLLVEECRRVLKSEGVLVCTTPFEDYIIVDEHLWSFDYDDMKSFFSKFTNSSILRFNHTRNTWEHFIVIAKK